MKKRDQAYVAGYEGKPWTPSTDEETSAYAQGLRDGRADRAPGENLARVAGMHLLTQSELADALGVSRQTINAAYSGKTAPSLQVLSKAAQLFGITVDDLLSSTQTCLIAAANAFDSTRQNDKKDHSAL